MNRPSPSAFIVPILLLSLILSVGFGTTFGRLAQSLPLHPFVANGICAGVTGALAVLFPNKLREAVNHRLAETPLTPMPKLATTYFASGAALIAMALFLSF